MQYELSDKDVALLIDVLEFVIDLDSVSEADALFDGVEDEAAQYAENVATYKRLAKQLGYEL